MAFFNVGLSLIYLATSSLKHLAGLNAGILRTGIRRVVFSLILRAAVFAICDEFKWFKPRIDFADMRSRLMREYISLAISVLVIFYTALNLISYICKITKNFEFRNELLRTVTAFGLQFFYKMRTIECFVPAR